MFLFMHNILLVFVHLCNSTSTGLNTPPFDKYEDDENNGGDNGGGEKENDKEND